jgi:hypothetical protein
MVTDFSRRMIDLYGNYKQGYLPKAGGLLDQPNAYVEAMDIIEAQMNRLQLERAKKNRRG